MTPSPEQEIEEQVITAIRERRDRGRLKYGTTMERQDLTPSDWCQHALEEALDLSIYLQRLKRDLLTQKVHPRRYESSNQTTNFPGVG